MGRDRIELSTFPLFRIKEDGPGQAMLIYLPASSGSVFADVRTCTWMYETKNETTLAAARKDASVISLIDSPESHGSKLPLACQDRELTDGRENGEP